jgi:hypothetical protein
MKKPAAKGSAKHTAPATNSFSAGAAKAAAVKSATAKHAAAKPGAKHGSPAPATNSFSAGAAKAAAMKSVKKAPVPAKKASAKAAPKTKTAPKKVAAKGVKGTASTFSPFELVACCSAAAVADHLRLSGGSCTADDMLGLYFAVADTDDSGADLESILAHAAEHGLAGHYPDYQLVTPDPDAIQIRRVRLPEARHAMIWHGGEWLTWDGWYPQSAFSQAVTEQAWELTWR